MKLTLSTDDMIVYIENPIVSTTQLLNLVSELSKIAGYNVNIQKMMAFCTPIMSYQKDRLGGNPIYYSNNKNKAPRNNLNQGGKRPVLRKLQNIEERN